MTNRETNFQIQPKHPKNNGVYDKEDAKLSEAIYTIFPMETKDAVLIWKDIEIPLSYRYDISIVIDELIQMIFVLQNEGYGEWTVTWSSNTFASDWLLKWNGNDLTLEANWREEMGENQKQLNQCNVIEVNRNSFLNEWKKIIKILIKNLEECGYNCDNLIDMKGLIEAKRIINIATKEDFCIFLEYRLCDLFKDSNDNTLNNFWCDGVTFEKIVDNKIMSFEVWIGLVSDARKQEKYKLFMHLGEVSSKVYLEGLDIKPHVPNSYQANILSIDVIKKEIHLNIK